MSASLTVCTTRRAGARRHAALAAAGPPEPMRIFPVQWPSVCSQGRAVALPAPGRWSSIYGRLSEQDLPEILAGAEADAKALDRIVPWRARPAIFRKRSVARLATLELA
ncbi:MAG: metal-binding protein [Tardiphaga sp.]|nr:metal-binding protein [Tardiphaga sp.]